MKVGRARAEKLSAEQRSEIARRRLLRGGRRAVEQTDDVAAVVGHRLAQEAGVELGGVQEYGSGKFGRRVLVVL